MEYRRRIMTHYCDTCEKEGDAGEISKILLLLYKIGDRHLPKDEPACKEVKRNFPTDAKKMASLNYGQNSFLTEINLDKFEITANARKQLAWIMPKINKDNF